jgi:pyruvate dehydrogenase E1 component
MLKDLEGLFTKQGVTSLASLSADWFERANAKVGKALDKDEFRTTIENAGLKLNDAEADSLFQHFDLDGGGTVTYGEFSQGLLGQMPEFSASLAFMHQHTGHFPSSQSQIRSARPQFSVAETEEWLESLQDVVEKQGNTRARFLLHEVMEEAARLGVHISQPVITPLVNTIPSSLEGEYPGDRPMEKRISDIVRWNAAVMVSDANKRAKGIGGHIGTFASICDVMEVGQNHFFRGKEYGGGRGDSVWMQGHAAPGAYARAYAEGRLSVQQVMNFRQEHEPNVGLSSYPHPRLMPHFWENPTVSMGLGPLGSVYQARFFRYLHLRGLANTSKSRVWCFVGDGESDEPESVTAISVAGRERLNNLIMIVNCNYQRLDGPVRGNSKVIQEFEGSYRGAGFDVIKLIWGSKFCELIEADHDGRLIEALEKTPDGDCQRLHSKSDGALIRKDIFEKHGLLDRVAHWNDAELLEAFNTPGGHDHKKIYAAMKQAELNAEMGGRPTVILVKTLKGYSLQSFLGVNTVHQKKGLSDDDIKSYRTQLNIPLKDEQLLEAGAENLFVLGKETPEVKYMLAQRQKLGGFLPMRQPAKISALLQLPGRELYSQFDEGSKGRPASTTMTFAALLRKMMQAGEFGQRVTLMVTDESRTFGLDAFFPLFKIHAPFGQNYTPVDADQVLKYSEAPDGQILQEGISEGGAIMTWIASATSYASQQAPTLPFLIYYSMFGFQRVGDSIWQAADARARGFLIGATYVRTTLNGEGLQHQDGHSLLIALTCPAVKGWDPAFGYEMGAILHHGVQEMWGEDKDLIYYVTAYNENYPQPAKPDGCDEGIIKGLYKFEDAKPAKNTVRIIGSGAIMKQAMDAVPLLAEFDVGVELWSATSYGQLYREAVECDRKTRLGGEAHTPWVTQCLGDGTVTVAVSDNMTAYPKLITSWVGGDFQVLGADGFGRSDTRENLRRFYEIDKESVAHAALEGLARAGKIPASLPKQAFEKYGLVVKKDDVTMDGIY